ncbi:MAG: GNAT family N-acetyltransferase [Clostridia bacterium]|jgi:ribosomal protein S18 acetylase RimI-like enzyme
MKYYKTAMIRPDLQWIPGYSLPDGYKLQLFQEKDEIRWAQIVCAAGEFPSVDDALKHFENEFSPYTEEMKKRCVFLTSPDNEYIGTTTAWYGDFQGERMGRIHWVAIKPEYQGRGLAKPMLSYALSVLAQYHDRAYLTTQTVSWKAVNMYLSFGFRPVKRSDDDEDFDTAWALIYEQLKLK